jgi:COX assembly protein 1
MAVELPKRVEEGARIAQQERQGCRGDALLCTGSSGRWRRFRTAAATAPGSLQTQLHALQTSTSPAFFPSAAALFYRLKQKGFQECSSYSDAYAACCSGRVLSVAWACRQEMKALSNCMATQ